MKSWLRARVKGVTLAAGDAMLTWSEVMVREQPCRKCKGAFSVRGPIDETALAEVRQLLDAGQPISAIRRIRELTGADLRDAKGMYEHITLVRGACRQCKGQLLQGILADCSVCGALNIDA